MKAKNNRIRRTAEDRVISIVVGIIMTFVFVVTVYPFWYSLVLSFSEGTDALRGGIYLWPRKFTLIIMRPWSALIIFLQPSWFR